MNQKGVVERDLTKKEAFYIFQSYWTSKPMVHIYGHSMPVRWGDANEEKMIKVYSNFDEAELWLNGKSVGKKKRNSQDFPAAGFRWSSALHKGADTVCVRATKGKEVVLDEISFSYQTEKWNKPSALNMEIPENKNGIVQIGSTLLDDKGVPCLDAANWIRFGLAGDGVLVDNLGTSDGSRYVQLYNGRVIISVDLRGGPSVASAQVQGIPSAFISL